MKSMNKGSYNSSGSGAKPSLGLKSSASGFARPGKRAVKSAAAAPVSSANGKIARPGFAQKAPKTAAGRGSIARPGGAESISGGNASAGASRPKTTG